MNKLNKYLIPLVKILLSLAFLSAGAFKIIGAEQMVGMYSSRVPKQALNLSSSNAALFVSSRSGGQLPAQANIEEGCTSG